MSELDDLKRINDDYESIENYYKVKGFRDKVHNPDLLRLSFISTHDHISIPDYPDNAKNAITMKSVKLPNKSINMSYMQIPNEFYPDMIKDHLEAILADDEVVDYFGQVLLPEFVTIDTHYDEYESTDYKEQIIYLLYYIYQGMDFEFDASDDKVIFNDYAKEYEVISDYNPEPSNYVEIYENE